VTADPIRFHDRYRGETREERIYGERWLRWAYGNPAGRFAVWLLIRRAFFSRWYGWKMKKKASSLRILPFISKYEIDVEEFAKSAFDYKTFNEFFTRALKPERRPVAPGDRVAVFPADGRHLVFPDIGKAEGVYVKGQRLSLADLLPEPPPFDASRAAVLISRLCPTDYHRYHFPADGTPGEPRDIPGWLYSVHPIALRRRLGYLVVNKRTVTRIDTPAFGPIHMVEVGATNVGSIVQSFLPGRPVRKGDEKGLFAFGGSCVITIFAPGRIVFDADLVGMSASRMETYARFGDRLGEAP
jgi:phosphatidylserine decarboxylase